MIDALRIARLKREFPNRSLADPDGSLRKKLDLHLSANRSLREKRIAVTVGSRGIDHLPEVVSLVITLLKEHGAQPFIVPAMGSHGGATADGQACMLATLGVDEKSVGAPVRSTMETVVIDEVEAAGKSWPVHMDRFAAEADGIVVLNRIKSHTDFSSEYESGLSKIMTVGLGKENGANAVHGHGTLGLKHAVPVMARTIVQKKSVVAGIGLVEDAQHRLAHIEVIPAHAIHSREPELLRLAKQWAADLPVDALDGLIISRIGKEISGTGIDTNVVGRRKVIGEEDLPKPVIGLIGVCDLTEHSHGNATGIGIADLTTAQVASKMDSAITTRNVVASTALERGKLPPVLSCDCEMIDVMKSLLKRRGIADPRIMFIRDTLTLDEFNVTAPLVDELCARQDISTLESLHELTFDQTGQLLLNY